MLQVHGLFEVLERVNDNSYKGDLLGDYGVSATFSVTDFSPYLQHDYLADLTSNYSQQGGEANIQICQGNSHFPAKIQEMIHILLSPN